MRFVHSLRSALVAAVLCGRRVRDWAEVEQVLGVLAAQRSAA
jgi:hypothetical protein